MKKPFQLVVLSGKGGVGKTNITAALSYHAASDAKIPGAVIVDADVDAANMSLLLNPHLSQQAPFVGGKIAQIDPALCAGCGICAEVCRFEAVYETDSGYKINTQDCEGCAACYYACPQKAISMLPHQDGVWIKSYTRFGPLFHAELFPGKDNSGKLVSLIRQEATQASDTFRFPLIIIDGPPGIGCPVISASTGVDLGLIVTEPSVAALHDLKRIHQTLDHFNIPAALCINKVGLNQAAYQAILTYAETEGLPVVGELPFDNLVPKAMAAGQVISEFATNSSIAEQIAIMWDVIFSIIDN